MISRQRQASWVYKVANDKKFLKYVSFVTLLLPIKTEFGGDKITMDKLLLTYSATRAISIALLLLIWRGLSRETSETSSDRSRPRLISPMACEHLKRIFFLVCRHTRVSCSTKQSSGFLGLQINQQFHWKVMIMMHTPIHEFIYVYYPQFGSM